MKYLLLLAIQCLVNLTLQSQCTCQQPDRTGNLVTVTNSAELQLALQNADTQGGNMIISLENGTYNLNQNLLYINPDMPNMTIRSAHGDRDEVIIRGQGMNGNVGWIFNVAADNFSLYDVTIGWVANHALQIHAEHDADNCHIRNVRFVNTREQMLKVSGSSTLTFSDNGLVECCLFEFTDGVAAQYYTGGIDAHRARNWIVHNNEFKYIRSPDDQLAEHAIHFWSNSEGTIVQNNKINNCDRGIGFGLTSDPDRGHLGGLIINNFVHTSRDVGIGLENARHPKVYNNTVITDGYFNSIEYRFDSTFNAEIFNNIVNKNISPRNGGQAEVMANYTVQDLSIFVNSNVYDYHLAIPNSSVLTAGLSRPEIQLDIDCNERKDFGLPDIGADEWQNTTSVPSDLQRDQLVILSNPFKDWLHISANESLTFSIINAKGQILFDGCISPDKRLTIPSLQWPGGLYYLVGRRVRENHTIAKLIKH